MSNLKLHKSHDEQIDILISRGLIVKDRQEVKDFLTHVNYYKLSGYLHHFKTTSGSYEEGLSFDTIQRIFKFDQEFANILLFALETIECSIKANFSYALTSAFPEDPLAYKRYDIVRNSEEHDVFLKKFNREVRLNCRTPFVRHHIENYDGEFPFWVAIELLTLGNIKSYYTNLLTPYQKLIASRYNTKYLIFDSWLENIRKTRNHLAHNSRIYDYNYGYSPLKCKKNFDYLESTNLIFDQIVLMKAMFPFADEWDEYIVPKIRDILERYGDVIELPRLGFPKDWEQILQKRK